MQKHPVVIEYVSSYRAIVKLMIGAWLLEDDGDGLPITTWLGPRPLCSALCTFEVGDKLERTKLFQRPVELEFRADSDPGRADGLLRIGVIAVPVDEGQFRELCKICDGSPTFTYDAMGKPGISLGHRWAPVEWPRLEAIPNVSRELLERYESLCLGEFDRLFWGNPTEEAERLLRSVPGISGEQG